MTREAMDRLERMKQKDRMMSQEPTKTYKRETIYTNMPWPLKVIQMGRTDVLIMIILIYALIFIGITLVVFFALKYLLGAVL